MTCPHARKFFYRQKLRAIGKRPVIPVVERCLDCGEMTRRADEITRAEVSEAVISPSLLAQDPWEGRRG